VIARSKPLRVLPCVDSTVLAPSIAVLRSTVGVDLLSVAPASTLIYRALNDDPDAIVIATEDFGTVAGQNDSDLIDVLSSTPTILLSGQFGPLVRKQSRSLAYSLRPFSGCDIGSIACRNPGYGGGPRSYIGAIRTDGRCICRLKHCKRNRTNR